MKTIQILIVPDTDCFEKKQLLRAVGVKRIHSGWYTVQYNGINLDPSTVCFAKRNPKGAVKTHWK